MIDTVAAVRDGRFLVLEDNGRTPSGVSYMLENRETMMAMFPELFMRVGVESVSNYPRRLARSRSSAAGLAADADASPSRATTTGRCSPLPRWRRCSV